MKHAKKKSGSSKGLLLIPLALLLLGGAVYGGWKLLGQRGGLEYENNVTIGSVDNGQKTLEQLQAAADRSKITMSINASPMLSLSDRDTGVNWLIANPEEQSTKLIRVEIYLDETGEKIYETGALRPGTYVTGTLPDIELSVGEYSCTAYFYSYDIDTQEFLGKAGTQICLYVLE